MKCGSKGSQNPSNARQVNSLIRLIDELGAAQTAKLFARALMERTKSDSMARTIADHLLVGVTQAEHEETERVAS